ncbi:glycosyltransferase [Pediococcus parvulus]|uniref:glycosyltransferase n=1 Tax=Pediococcus parvulus TaxID=54062 RepID=UPI00345E3FD9
MISSNFSLLMSVYKNDNPGFLRMALNSVYNQSICPKEIILVQDGPIPLSLSKVINDFAFEKKNIISLIKPKNQGLGLALRDGLSYVSTKWVARMDADDINLPNRFELQINYLKKHPETVLLGGQICEFKNDYCKILSRRLVPVDSKQISEFIKWRNPFNHVTVMIKVKAIREAGNYQNIGGFEDYDLWNRMIVRGYAFHNLPDDLVLVRVGDGMYERRGGIKYFQRYIKLKSNSKKLGIINRKEEIISDTIMMFNIIIPKKMRAFLYNRILRH